MALKPIFSGQLIAIGGAEDTNDDLIVLKRVIQEVKKKDYKILGSTAHYQLGSWPKTFNVHAFNRISTNSN